MKASVRAKQIESVTLDFNNRMKWVSQSSTWRKKAYHLGNAAKLAEMLEKLEQEEHDDQFKTEEVETIKADQILSKAAGHLADRADTYDSPGGERSMEKTVQIFNLYSGHSLTTYQGWRFMQILKMVRADQGKPKLDNHEDEAAYVGLAAEAKFQEKP